MRELNLGGVQLDAWIWVVLAVAWAAYLIPKALTGHDNAAKARSVDRFSHTMRVLARREPVDRRNTRLVVPAADAVVVLGPSPVEVKLRRESAKRAARRRRRVLSLILIACAAVAGVAGYGLIEWVYVAIPAGLLVAWLIACRVMVRGEHRAWDRLIAPAPLVTPAEGVVAEAAPDEETVSIDAATIAAAMKDPALWDPVPVTLPTYVTKPTAPRTVRTIDLDSDGVWTSGHTAADSALAREADEAARVARTEEATDDERAVGS
jgi:hypothetical protein